ncbi:hypothetical protein CTheo_6915 [Ceratobasidium theobromae]|uniref:Uncharacterized protein n=1 Tax=Ceratobasidium theobromae TaxID=1582974 RepID=A0A5N5QD22_9AGAM|nr:hypothetical protein CTheo_6915 [Ceratobasidium theobromae]
MSTTEPTIMRQLTPIIPLDNAATNTPPTIQTMRIHNSPFSAPNPTPPGFACSNVVLPTQHESTAGHPSSIPQHSEFTHAHLSDPSFILNVSAFNTSTSGATLPAVHQSIAAPVTQPGWTHTLSIPEPNPGFIHPNSIDPLTPSPLPFDIGQDVTHEMFWNPWVGGAQDGLATNSLDAPSTQVNVEPTVGLDHARHCLPSGQAYIRRVSKGRVIYRHPTAGQTFGKGQTRWEAERAKNKTLRGGNRWAMWKDKDEWETVKWMATTKVSQSGLNNLLKTKRYQDANYSFKTAKGLFKKIRDEMEGFGGPGWNAEDVILPGTDENDRVTLFYRDLQESADFQFGRPWFAGKMSFGPEIHYNADESERLIGNPWTAEDWNKRQNTLPPGTTYGGILLASDSTQLSTHSGDVAAHAVYMSLANLDKSIRASTSKDAWMLVAYIPKSKFKHTMAKLEHRPKAVRTKLLGVLNRRLFHRCMEVITRSLRRTEPHDVIDPEGNIHSVLYELTAYIADLEEQWLIAGLGGQTCPHCTSEPSHLGDPERSLPRTPVDILHTIKQIKRNYRATWGRSPSLEEFVNLSSEYHLNGVDKPFWKSLPQLNIFETLSPDLLHGFHKFFHDHIYKFNRTGMGDRNFLHGVSHISQMTGIEHRMLERTHLPIVANAPGVINQKVTRATRGAMECIYLAQLPIQSDHSLQAYEAAYEEFMANRQAWIENETRRGKHEVIPHFNIPKMHVTRHFVEHVRRKGSADNFTTETMEHLHVGVKEAYRASNRREWKQQTVRWLTQREKIRDFEAWMLWCESEEQDEVKKNNLMQDGDEFDLSHGVNPEDGSDGSSVDVPIVEEDIDGSESDEEDPGRERGEQEEYEDPEEYGGLLGNDGGEEEVGEVGGTDKVRGWLRQQVGAGERSRKRKRRIDLDGPIVRNRPHPRLQATHGLSDLQKINKKPSTHRKSIQEVCKQYNLDVDQLMLEVGRCAALAKLPISVDKYTEIDTWNVLRTLLHSTAHHSGARMQRIRAKPATRDHVAKHDPLLYVDSGQELVEVAKLNDCLVGQAKLIFRLTPTTLVPDPPLMVYTRAFSRIPQSACRVTGLLSVKKVDGRRQHRIVLASDIQQHSTSTVAEMATGKDIPCGLGASPELHRTAIIRGAGGKVMPYDKLSHHAAESGDSRWSTPEHLLVFKSSRSISTTSTASTSQFSANLP